MRSLLALVSMIVVLLSHGAVRGAACSTTAPGSTALEKAANGLAAGEWCEMTPAMLNFTLNANAMNDVLGGCGNGSTSVYNHNMAYDPSQGTAGIVAWAGTGHNSSGRAFYYDIGTNTWNVGPFRSTYVGCGSAATCFDSDWENGNIMLCNGAEHTYDSMTDDNNGSFLRADYGSDPAWIEQFTTSAWNVNYINAATTGGDTTSALEFWPDAGTTGTLVRSTNGTGCNSALWLYDMTSGVWSDPFADTWSGCPYHNTINYNHGSGEVWVTAGNGATDHHRLWLNGGTPTLTRLSAAPSGRLGLTNSNCTDDPVHPSGKFVCWDHSEDSVGTSSAGWYEYDMGTDTWTPFSALGITSMPPLKKEQAFPYSVTVPDYGVLLWITEEDDESNNGGMFVYRHTDNDSGNNPPAPPPKPQTN